ncbi:hypothetical protein GWK47_025047 [Chionoecetes opilio]|uniref:Uncharacterized protein n=1 Tax=Chionoecetes opilio TaxID=41210 RepID=A0A8J4XMY2_CHIOP|nr:hypothetical protein GWK47_025047 [Chionoecetes opilio]
MTDNLRRSTPYESADPTRLGGASELDCLISSGELRGVLRRSRSSCPGVSGINKAILSYISGLAMDRLRDILNAALSAGYFPDRFKEADMRMLIKGGKAPTRPDSLSHSPWRFPENLFEESSRGAPQLPGGKRPCTTRRSRGSARKGPTHPIRGH